MRTIEISTEVFARIWSLRQDGEESEDAILRRILFYEKIETIAEGWNHANCLDDALTGYVEERYGVAVPEDFQISRIYLGKEYSARAISGKWLLEQTGDTFTTLNQLSRAVTSSPENAWKSWFYVDQNGERKALDNLRDNRRITSRSR